MSRMLRSSPADFQRFRTADGGSMQHERDMIGTSSRLELRHGLLGLCPHVGTRGLAWWPVDFRLGLNTRPELPAHRRFSRWRLGGADYLAARTARRAEGRTRALR